MLQFDMMLHRVLFNAERFSQRIRKCERNDCLGLLLEQTKQACFGGGPVFLTSQKPVFFEDTAKLCLIEKAFCYETVLHPIENPSSSNSVRFHMEAKCNKTHHYVPGLIWK